MQKAVAVGDINNVVVHGKRLEESSRGLKEQEQIMNAMDTQVAPCPIEVPQSEVRRERWRDGEIRRERRRDKETETGRRK